MRARVIWFSPEMGGRESGPPPGPDYAPTAIFLNPLSSADSPPESSLYASVRMSFIAKSAEGVIVELRPFAIDLVRPYLYDGSSFLVMEGAQPVGYGRMIGDGQSPS